MPNEELEKLKQKQHGLEKKLTAAKHKEKQLEHKLKQLTRSERTHRLCTRAGMLAKFLREPTLLTVNDCGQSRLSGNQFIGGKSTKG